MNTNWNIAQIKRIPSNGLVIEVTYIMNFTLEGETDRKVGSIELSGSTNDPNFIPYEDLTEQIVLNWVQNEIGASAITSIETEFQTRLQEKIDRKNNPPFLTGIPWDNN